MNLWKLTQYILQRADDPDLDESSKFLQEKSFLRVLEIKTNTEKKNALV